MTENETTETVETVVEKPARKAKLKKSKAPRVKAEKPPKAPKAPKPPGFDFIGKVESLHVASGAGPAGFAFGLKGRHGKRHGFRLDAADAFAASAMVQVVLAAHAGGTRIGIRIAPEADGVLTVREIESRPGLRHKD